MTCVQLLSEIVGLVVDLGKIPLAPLHFFMDSSTYDVIQSQIFNFLTGLNVISLVLLSLVWRFKYVKYSLLINMENFSCKWDLLPKYVPVTDFPESDNLQTLVQKLIQSIKSDKVGLEEYELLLKFTTYVFDSLIKLLLGFSFKLYAALFRTSLFEHISPVWTLALCILVTIVLANHLIKRYLTSVLILVLTLVVLWVTNVLDHFVIRTILSTLSSTLDKYLWPITVITRKDFCFNN